MHDEDNASVKAYHRTHHSAAILRDGFRDGSYMLPVLGEQRGVFVSADWPVDENEGADGDAVLEVDLPAAVFTKYEWVTEDSTWREAMIPAAELNRSPVRLLTEDEVDELTLRRWDSFHGGEV
jgi:hypothetical protein